WADRTVAAQEADPASTLSFYRQALAARRKHAVDLPEDVDLLDAGPDVLTYRRSALTVVLNTGDGAVELPAGEIVVASGELDGRQLPPDTAVWLLPDLR
ncbi:MAG TPA: DUF3459 domain-containing protein, partial [Nocardioides sp.]|nr:DUF3459 domain-containing protein [Nocardioides sp.]